LTVTLKNGGVVRKEVAGYEGFHTRPMSWEGTVRKFYAVAGERRFRAHLDAIVKAVWHLEKIPVRDLVMNLG
jgi:2-methylcitrate dehydratase